MTWGNEDGSALSSSYQLNANEIPTGETIITEVEPKEETGSKDVKIRVKASFNKLETLVSEKKLSLSEVEDSLLALKQETKGASSGAKSADKAAKTNPPKKVKKSKVNFSSGESDEDARKGTVQTAIEFAQQAIMTGAFGAYEFRAIILFGVSAVAISLYGDRVSV